jgi:hypothetical protein
MAAFPNDAPNVLHSAAIGISVTGGAPETSRFKFGLHGKERVHDDVRRLGPDRADLGRVSPIRAEMKVLMGVQKAWPYRVSQWSGPGAERLSPPLALQHVSRFVLVFSRSVLKSLLARDDDRRVMWVRRVFARGRRLLSMPVVRSWRRKGELRHPRSAAFVPKSRSGSAGGRGWRDWTPEV